MSSEFLYIGHRGTRTNFDENTIEAFKKASEFGATYIEFDVRKTKDEKFIIMHDATLDRTTNGSGLLNNLKYNEIDKIKTKIHNCPIPLLSDVLKELKGSVKYMIELKDDDLKDKIPKIVKKYNLLEESIFSGRNLKDLQYIKQAYPKNQICYNITKGLGFKINEFLKIGRLKQLEFKPDLISLRSNLISKEFVEICHDNEIKSLAWDFISYEDPIVYIKSLIKLGIDGILFDDYRNIPKIKDWVNTN
ncbi:MAG: glycerophosphodiester phosphodiesterase [Candidatus Hodarchaeota archaeon]